MARDIVLSLQAEARAFKAQLQGASGSVSQLSTALREASASAQRASAGFGKAKESAFSFGKGVTAIATSVTASLAVIERLGSVASAGLDLDLASAAVKQTIGEFAKFDAGVRRVAAGMGSMNLAGIGRELANLGLQSGYSADEILGGAQALSQLGATEASLQPLLEVATKIAGVTGTDLTQSAETAMGVMNAFGLSIENVTQVQTAMIQAAGASGATIKDLGTAIGYVGPIARATGNTLLDIIPAVEALRDKTIDASTAGTSLRAAFSRLAEAPDEVADGLRDIGLSIDQVNPSMHKFIDIIGTLEKASLDLPSALKIFGREAGGAILALTQAEHAGKKGAAALREYQKELTDAAAAQAKINLLLAGVAFNMKKIEGAYKAAGVQVGAFVAELTGLDSALATTARQATDLVASLQNLTAGEFSDIVINVVSDGKLGAEFEAAANRVGPPLANAAKLAMQLGAHTLVGFAPVIGHGIAKAVLSVLGSAAPKIFGGLINTVNDIGVNLALAVNDLVPGAEGPKDEINRQLIKYSRDSNRPITQGANALGEWTAKGVRELDGPKGFDKQFADSVAGALPDFKTYMDANQKAMEAVTDELNRAYAAAQQRMAPGALRSGLHSRIMSGQAEGMPLGMMSGAMGLGAAAMQAMAIKSQLEAGIMKPPKPEPTNTRGGSDEYSAALQIQGAATLRESRGTREREAQVWREEREASARRSDAAVRQDWQAAAGAMNGRGGGATANYYGTQTVYQNITGSEAMMGPQPHRRPVATPGSRGKKLGK